MTAVPGAVTLILSSAEGDLSARSGEPVRVGVPFPKGAVSGVGLMLMDAGGRAQPLQWRALSCWADGSVRWALLDWLADRPAGLSQVEYRLHLGDGADSPGGLAVAEAHGAITVDTGAARFRLSSGGNFPFDEILVGGAPAVGVVSLEVDDEHGRRCRVSVTGATIEEAGPVRAVVRVAAVIESGGAEPLLNVSAWLHFCAASAVVRFELTVHNPRRASHPGGLWELGDEGSVLVRDISFVATLPDHAERAGVACSPEWGSPFEMSAGDLEVFQASSGGARWNSPTHVDRTGAVPMAVRGYRLRGRGAEHQGRRATPIISIAGAEGTLSMAMPRFWQNFPKTMAATGPRLVLGLFPREHGVTHELQGGEQKTHVFHIAFGRDPITSVPLEWTRAPLVARATPMHYCESDAVSYLQPAAVDPHSLYLQLVNAAVDGDDRVELKREIIDEYGWRNFGDFYADHEAAGHQGERPFVSHYNNQYDAVAGLAIQFMRTGDLRWWTLCVDLAPHVVDIDLYHTDRDKAAYNHGLFWHTVHYIEAGRSTHRSYPKAPGVRGGGPSPEHDYSSGLLLHHFMTGDPRSRAAALDLAAWVLDMDDGAKTVFRWIARVDTGMATSTNGQQVPGRGAGNSIVTLLNAHHLSGERRFLLKAEALIRRMAHPDDNVESRDLLNAEQRWSYTVFLHALGRYLDVKAEAGELDAMYSYARGTLLTYARWMADRERPYLDEPEKLEYPTETWAAQEMWKSEVFDFAARHATAIDRARFLERAEFFFRYATTTLAGMPTRTVTRAVVLLLSHGWMRGFCISRPPGAAPAPPAYAHARQKDFVPQRAVVIRRIRAAAFVGFAAAAAAALAWLV